MMSKLGEGAIIELDSRRSKELIKDEDEYNKNSESRFIIDPNNYYKIKWNHLICLIFIMWIFATPFWISEHRYLQERNF